MTAKYLHVFLIFSILFASIFLWPLGWSFLADYRFVLVALFALLGQTLLTVEGRQSIKIHWLDLVLAGPALLSFASMFWARDPGLALDNGMNWLLFYLVFRYLGGVVGRDDGRKALFLAIQIAFIANTAILVYGTLGELYWAQKDIQFLVGYNHNYIATLLLLTLPFFVLETLRKKQIALALVTLGALFACLLFMDSQMGKIFFIVEVGALLALQKSANGSKKRLLIGIFSLLSLAAIGAIVYYWDVGSLKHEADTLVRAITRGYETNRHKLCERSFQLMLDSNFVGVGGGNWVNEICRYGLDGFSSLGDLVQWRFYDHPHNLPMLLVAEFGLLGVILVLTTVVLTIRHLRVQKNPIDPRIAAFALLGYAFVSGLYGVSHFLLDHFAGHLIVVATAYALIRKTGEGRRAAYFLLALNAILVAWFLYETVLHNKYTRAATSVEKVELLDRWTHPKIKSHIKKLPVQKAMILALPKDDPRLLSHSLRWLQTAPHNPEAMYYHARNLHKNGRTEEARELVLGSEEIKSSIAPNVLLMAQIACATGDTLLLEKSTQKVIRYQNIYDSRQERELTPRLQRKQKQVLQYIDALNGIAAKNQNGKCN